MDSSQEDYHYSLVALKSPRIAKTLQSKVYRQLSAFDKRKCIDLRKKYSLVNQAIATEDMSELLYGNLTDEELDLYDIHGDDGTERIEITVYGQRCTIDESSGYICFDGAACISKLWMLDNPMSWDLRSVDLKALILDNLVFEQLRHMYGVFRFELVTNVENHGFVLYMTVDTITVYNTYGGFIGVWSTEFNRDNWLDTFLGFPKLSLAEQKRTYHLVWGFTSEMVAGVVAPIRQSVLYEGLSYGVIY